jgi:hypothetical protein
LLSETEKFDLSILIGPGMLFRLGLLRLGLLRGTAELAIELASVATAGNESLFFTELKRSFSGVPGRCLGALCERILALADSVAVM